MTRTSVSRVADGPARVLDAGGLRIVVATTEAVVDPGDGGRTFDVLLRH